MMMLTNTALPGRRPPPLWMVVTWIALVLSLTHLCLLEMRPNDQDLLLASDDSVVYQGHPTAKGHLIWHVGPSKTATTTLQTDLTTLYDQGHLPNYQGRYYRPYEKDGHLLLNRSESELLVAARSMLHHHYCPNITQACCSHFVKTLEAWYEHHQPSDPLLFSDEALGNLWLTPDHYMALNDALGSDWNVTVVVGYRRFYDWIVSSKFQRDRTDRISRQGKELWPHDGGRALLPMFPDTFRDWRHWFPYTDAITRSVGNTFGTRILQLHHHHESSVLTVFLCETLAGLYPRACETSRRRDQEQSETVMNAQATTTVPSLFYDAVATRAADSGLVDTTVWKRAQVREAIHRYHEVVRHQQPYDLPLQCPNSSDYRRLYQVSVEMEDQFFPDGDRSVMQKGFIEKMASKAYCWVNATAVLEQADWQNFFRTKLVKK